MSQSDALSRLVDAVRFANDPDQVARIVSSFRMAHVVMTTADYNDDLRAMFEWQEAAKTRLSQYESAYGALPHDLDYEGLTDHPLGFFADESDNF